MNQTLKIPTHRGAFISENSYNKDNNTIEVVFATSAEVKRQAWDGSQFTEILECSPDNVRLERMNAGANLVDSHTTYSIQSILGVVVRAWVENNQCKALVRLSQRAEVAGYVDDIASGIMRNVSVGYLIHQVQTTENTDNNTLTVRITDWEPSEISILSVPADYRAGTRGDKGNFFYEINYKTRNMDLQTQSTSPTAAPDNLPENLPDNLPEKLQGVDTSPAIEAEAIANRAIAAERNRVAEITKMVGSVNINDADFLRTLIDGGKSLEQARGLVLDKLIAGQPAPSQTTASVSRVNDRQAREQTLLALQEVLLHRANPAAGLSSDKAKEMRHASLLDMAVISLQAAGQRANLGALSKNELVKRAMSSSDYPLLLANTINRSLRAAYESVLPAWRKFARKRNASDFKIISSVGVGGDFRLKKIKESGEYQQAYLSETGDSFKLETYGRKISITRQAIINDDLSGFMRYTELFGRGAAELQADIVYSLLTLNGYGRKLPDGKSLFDSAHKNLAASPSALSVASLSAARLAMRRQTGLTGEKIVVNPKYLVIPPELETMAYQLIYSPTSNVVVAEANPFKGTLELIVDPFLTDPKAWYLVADPSTIPVIEYAFLDGQEGLYTEQKVDFDSDNLDIKVRTDFAATIEEFRGVYKNAGA